MPTTSRAQHKEFSPDKLIDAMRAKNMNSYDLADEIGASVEAVARWVGGIAVPKPVYLKQTAQVLSVEPDDLFVIS